MLGGMYLLLIVVCCWYYWYNWHHQHHQVIVNHLKRYNCNPTLYLLVRHAKKTLGNAGEFTEVLRVESSIKWQKGQKTDGRYIIPVLLSEFSKYSEKDKRNILNYLGFTIKQYKRFITDKNIGPGTDLILGVDGSKGKLYLDYDMDQGIALKCLESTGKLKYYIKICGGDVLRVESNGNAVGYHYRLKQPSLNEYGDRVYWIARGTDGSRTYYTRPHLWLVELIELIELLKSKLIRQN